MAMTFHTNQAPLQINHSQTDEGVTLVTLAGDLDSSGAGLLRNKFDRLLASGARVIVMDCSQVGYASSAGIGAIIHVHRQAQSADGRLLVVGTDTAVFEVLRLMNLGSILELYPDVAQAVSTLRRTPGA